MQLHEEDILGQAYDARLMRRLFSYLMPYKAWILATLLIILVTSLIQVSGPILTQVGIDQFIATKDLGGLNQIALLYLGIVFAGFFLGYLQTYIMQLTGQKIMVDLRMQIFSHLQKLPLSFYDKSPVGRLMTRVTTDVDVLNELFSTGVVTILGDLLVLFGIVAIIFYHNFDLALVALSVVPLLVIITLVFKIKARNSYRRVRTAIARISAFLQEQMTGMSIVQLFNHEARSFRQFEGINRVHLMANLDSILAYSMFYPAVELVSSLAIALIVWYGGGQILSDDLTFGELVLFIYLSEKFFRPIADLSEKYNILQSAMASSERIFKLLDTPATLQEPTRPVQLDRIRGEIEFNHVWFAYKRVNSDSKSLTDGSQGDWQWILKDVSFRIPAGEAVAIVGHTGAGKTTLINLVMRFYDIQKGQILLDGHDIRSLDVLQLRKAFGLVLQDVFLFSGTIASNIRLGTPWITEKAIHTAAQDVNLSEFVATFPNGYREVVKERGSTLSTGEKQLIAFARALAHDPRNLILDEATSSVDTGTEKRIREAIVRLMEGRTCLIIAHRLSTIQRVNRIIVLHKGEVREIGSHQKLLAKRGLYFKLFQLQYQEQEKSWDRPTSQPSPDDLLVT